MVGQVKTPGPTAMVPHADGVIISELLKEIDFRNENVLWMKVGYFLKKVLFRKY